MSQLTSFDGRQFEELVRQTARWVWSLPPGEGASQFVGGYEIDCVCRTEDVIHIIECTVDRTLKKVRQDTDSLKAAKIALEKQGYTVRPWIVTLHEPSPDQRTFAHNQKITMLSIEQFRNRILKAPDYINSRWNYRFGSAADPMTGAAKLAEDEYVSLPMKDVNSGLEYSVQGISELLVQKKLTVVLLGPFGAGKSLTVREIFRHLRLAYFKDSQQPVPLTLNLRDHWGQDDTDEVLRRHAARVGFAGRDELVRAWNAGLLLVMLDGFDELASQAWRIAPAELANVQKIRYEAVKIIRAFQKENKGRFGILLTGRDHYFDREEEMDRALALSSDTVKISIAEFTEEQAQKYLVRKGIKEVLPDWLPRKPLLLGYLAARDLLNEVLQIDGAKGVAKAWDVFLDKICEREAGISHDIEGTSVRRLLELLATEARASSGGAGPLFDSSLSAAYARVTGSEPLEEARTLLQRLPGLTARDQQEGGRSFVDPEMLDALRGSAVARFIMDPYAPPAPEGRLWNHSLGELGYSLCGMLTAEWDLSPSVHCTAAREAVGRWEAPILALDCVLSAVHRADDEPVDCNGIVIKEGQAETLDFEHANVSNLELQWCHIKTLILGDAQPENVRLYNCLIERIVGVSDAKGLPAWIAECEIGKYDSLQTNAAIMRLSSPLQVRVLLTILRKLFLQKGRARMESAMYRGLEPNAAKFVPQIMDLVRKSGFAERISLANGAIWHPHRSRQARVQEIVATLGMNDDPLVRKAWDLK